MSVAINSTRKTVEISWDPEAGATEPSPPEGFPSHPIAPGGGPHPSHPIAPGGEAPDHTLPGDLPRPDHDLPGSQPHPDHELPPSGVGPSHPIYLPPYVDIGFPGDQPYPSHPIAGTGVGPDNTLPAPEGPVDPNYGIPENILDEIPEAVREKLVEFLTGNLPPGPMAPTPVSEEQARKAVQVFAQGQEGDWSNTAVMPNDGLAALAYPKDFKGESYIEVRALDGTLVDSGTIKVT